MSTKTFLMQETGRQRIYLRRYSSGSKCPGSQGYHDAMNFAGERLETKDSRGYIEPVPPSDFMDDPRWPAKCEACDYEFKVADDFQIFRASLYQSDTGLVTVHKEFPAGAIWNAWWLNDHPAYTGPDGKSLHCRLPGGHDWCIDGRAKNCDSPCKHCGVPYHSHMPACKHYEDSRPHKCWVRTGVAPVLDVTKGKPGESCNAGAGSIVVPGWHGFLRNGVLTTC